MNPLLNNIPSNTDYIDAFEGYNHNVRIKDNEFYAIENMSSSDYPVLSSRKRRGLLQTVPEDRTRAIVGIANLNGIWVIELSSKVGESGTLTDTHMFAIKGKVKYDLGAVAEANMELYRQVITMGAYILVYPDKKYINTVNTGEKGDMEYKAYSDFQNYALCDFEGNEYTVKTEGKEAPAKPTNGDIWIDTSETKAQMKVYSTTTSTWTAIPKTFVKFESLSGELPMREGDAVKVTANILPNGLAELWENEVVIEKVVKGDSGHKAYIIRGLYTGSITEEMHAANVEFKLSVPDFDYVCECNNRIWGCKCGQTDKGFVNEIYASKLGDFRNFKVFQGLSTDSYTASIGKEGEFTGCIAYLGTPLFFKTNIIYRVYGSYPANYQIQQTECNGVKKGCNGSLCIINGTLYYTGEDSVYAYSGGMPVDIGTNLNKDFIRFTDISDSGRYDNKYYLSLYNSVEQKGIMLVFDTARGIWHKEGEINNPMFCEVNINGKFNLAYVNTVFKMVEFPMPPPLPPIKLPVFYQTVNTIEATDDIPTYEQDIKWNMETGIIGATSHEQKYLNKIAVRCKISIGKRVHFWVQYDSNGKWEKVGTITGRTLRSYDFFIKLKRCDHLRIKIEGEGDFQLFSIGKNWQFGGDRIC